MRHGDAGPQGSLQQPAEVERLVEQPQLALLIQPLADAVQQEGPLVGQDWQWNPRAQPAQQDPDLRPRPHANRKQPIAQPMASQAELERQLTNSGSQTTLPEVSESSNFRHQHAVKGVGIEANGQLYAHHECRQAAAQEWQS